MWLDSVVDRRTVLCILDAPPSNGDELLRRVLTDFGLLSRDRQSASEVSSLQMMQVLEGFLASLRALKARAFIVIENAERADSPTREEIQRLSDLDPGVLEILLVSPPAAARGSSAPRVIAGLAAAAALVAVGWLWFARARVAVPNLPASAAVRPPSRAATAVEQPAGGAAAVPALPAPAPGFLVQVGAFRDPARADAIAARLRDMKLPAAVTITATGLRQVSVGPYARRAEAAAIQGQVKEAGLGEPTLTAVTIGLQGTPRAADRALLARAAALAGKHDVRALEALRTEWLASAPGPSAADPASPTLIALDRYLDAARRAQLLADRRQLLQDSSRK